MQLQPASLDTFQTKYQLKKQDGTPVDKDLDGTFERVANALANAEPIESDRFMWKKSFKWALENGAIPAGRILSNAGAEELKPNTSLINCTVSANIPDNIEGIGQMVKESMQTLAKGCGIGYCASTLRPKGAFVGGVGATTSGSLSFMNIFDASCFTISSAGGRRGAQMMTMHVWHPDILDFIKAKREDGRFRQFNLSVLLTDEFMEAVEADEDWDLYFPVHSKEYASLKDVGNTCLWVSDFPFESSDYIYFQNTLMVACKVYQTLKARELWDIIMRSTYEYSEPGVLLIDRYNQANPLNSVEHIVASNPCGEQGLPPYGSCLLGSILLTKFVNFPFQDGKDLVGDIYSPKAEFDWDKFKEVTRIFVRMLDNVVELNGLALEQQVAEIKNKRRHGMGFLGLGSALAMLRIPYGSAEAIAFTEEVAKVIAVVNLEEGVKLAKEKGAAPIFLTEDKQDLNKTFYKWLAHPFIEKVLVECSEETRQDIAVYGCRFTHATSIAPTGTLSLAIGNNCSNGIEPSFAHEYKRNIVKEGNKTKEQVTVYSAEALLWKELYGDTPYPDYFTVADDLTPAQHVAMQAAAQKWVDSSISKTVNCPTDISFEDFKQVYIDAYNSGLKGCATFRFNPEIFSGVLVREEDLAATTYEFTLASGETVVLAGNETVIYEGEPHNVANLFDALKEGYFGRF